MDADENPYKAPLEEGAKPDPNSDVAARVIVWCLVLCGIASAAAGYIVVRAISP